MSETTTQPADKPLNSKIIVASGAKVMSWLAGTISALQGGFTKVVEFVKDIDSERVNKAGERLYSVADGVASTFLTLQDRTPKVATALAFTAATFVGAGVLSAIGFPWLLALLSSAVFIGWWAFRE